MIRSTCLALALALAAGSVAGSAEVLYAAGCPAADRPPVVDGDLKDACWDGAAVIDDFGKLFSTAKPLVPPTRVKLLHDKRSLYIGCYFAETDMQRLEGNIHNKQIAMWWRDCTEIFIDPEHGHVRFYKIFANPIDEKGLSRRWDDGWGAYWDDLWGKTAGVECVAKLHADSWQVELAIPWLSLGRVPEPGMVMGFNVNRFWFDKSGGKPFYTWSARGNVANNDAAFFGHVILGEPPKSMEALVAACIPDFAEKEVIVPGKERLAVFAEGAKREYTYDGLRAAAAKWFEDKTAELDGLMVDEQRAHRAFAAPRGRQAELLRALAERSKEVGEAESFGATMGVDFLGAQFSVQKDIDALRGMVRVADLIKKVQAGGPE